VAADTPFIERGERIPGIGEKIAATIISEIGEIDDLIILKSL
jgi:5'-3' exonuclease